MIIAMDGPAGSGKTTIAKKLAEKLGLDYLDTGATYRTLTLKALRDGVSVNDEKALSELALKLNINFDGTRVLLDGEDVTDAIRMPEINNNISPVVAHPGVREAMVNLQREIAQKGDYVVEGRDITTVVFPNAEHKFYMDAKFEIRFKRRWMEIETKGMNITKEELTASMRKRDIADTTREVGALKIADDAYYFDTSDFNIDQVIEKLSQLIKRNG